MYTFSQHRISHTMSRPKGEKKPEKNISISYIKFMLFDDDRNEYVLWYSQKKKNAISVFMTFTKIY